MANYGITSNGFTVKQQSVIISEINSIIMAIWGPNVNLGPQSNFGQLAGIFSEREALIWQLLEAVYNSQYPSGAEGTSVDNILALNNLRRLPATATITNSENDIQSANPSNGVTLYGLLLWGTPGTLIPQNSIINTAASPPLSFLTQNNYTVGAIVNAVQTLYFSNTPNTGSFTLNFYDPSGNILVTPTISYNALAAVTQLNISTTPGSTSHFALTLTKLGVALTTANISTNSAYPTATAVQTAIRALSGYGAVNVTNPTTGNYNIDWGTIVEPITTVSSNTTGATLTVINSIQADINNLLDSTTGYYPLSDLVVTGAIGSSLVFTYGGTITASPNAGTNPFCGGQQQALFDIATNVLYNGSTFTTIQPSNTTAGAGVWGTGSALSATQGFGTNYGTIGGIALCTVTGPNFVADGSLSVIGSAVSGWQGVVNQLVCVTGTVLESDTAALTRRALLLAANASTPLASIIDAVTALVEPVNGTVIGFENTTQAALQVLTFGTVPATGSFKILLGSLLTGAISTFTAAAIQTAIRLLTGYSNVLVTGGQTGSNAPIFTIDFNGSLGGQPQPLVSIPSGSNSTGCVITPSFGRPGGSFEIVVGNQGSVTDAEIAKLILANKAAGVQAYGNILNIVFDAYNNSYQIGFSTPSEINFYVVISLTTDYYNVPGNTGSGVNPLAKFSPGSIPTIIQDILTIGNAFGIGATGTSGQVIGFGSNGLIGAFNSVAGIISYTLFFGTAPSPGSNANVSILSEQQAVFLQLNTSVSWS